MSTFTVDRGSDRVFNIVNSVILTIFLVSVAYPLVYTLSASFSDPRDVISGRMWLWPVNFTTEGYKAVFENSRITVGFRNSLFYTVSATIVGVILTTLAAYPLSRRDLAGRNWIMLFFVFTLLFAGGLIPRYLVVKELGLLNTAWAIILPSAFSVWQLIITRTFFQSTIPDELLEAAQLDGCSDFRFVWDVVVPLSMPILMVNGLFYAVQHWNAYFDALIFLTNTSLFPLQLVLREILIQNQVDVSSMQLDASQMAQKQFLADLLKYSLIVVACTPILVIYPFVQKYFVRGVLIGSLKG